MARSYWSRIYFGRRASPVVRHGQLSGYPVRLQSQAVYKLRHRAQTAGALVARIFFPIFPMLSLMCGGQIWLLVSVTVGAKIGEILDHIGVDAETSVLAMAREIERHCA